MADVDPSIDADQATELLNQHTQNLESGLDKLQQKAQTDPTARALGVTPPSELPPTPTFDNVTPVGELTTPEATAEGQAGLAAEVAQPPPEQPALPWRGTKEKPGIADTATFKALSPEDQMTAANAYAQQGAAYARHTGGDPNVIDGHVKSFLADETNRAYPPPSWLHQLVTNTWYAGNESLRQQPKETDEQYNTRLLNQPAPGERPPGALSMAKALDAIVGKLSGGRAGGLTNLVLQGTRDPNPGEMSFSNLGIPHPFGQQTGIAAQLGAAAGNLPIDIMNFLAAPGTTASGSMKILGDAPALVQKLVGYGIGAQQAIQAIKPNQTLQERAEAVMGAFLAAGTAHVLDLTVKEKAQQAELQYNADAAKANEYRGTFGPDSQSGAAQEAAANSDFEARMANVRTMHEELTKFRQGGVQAVSPEARAVIFGIDPEAAGTTVEQAQAYADKIGVKWQPPEKAAEPAAAEPAAAEPAAAEPATPATAEPAAAVPVPAEPVKSAAATAEPVPAPAAEPAAVATAEPAPAETPKSLGGRGLIVTPHPDLPNIPAGSRMTGAVLTAMSGPNKGEVLARGDSHADALNKATQEIINSPEPDMNKFDALSAAHGDDAGHRFGVVDREGKPILDAKGNETTLSRQEAGALATGKPLEEAPHLQSPELQELIAKQGEPKPIEAKPAAAPAQVETPAKPPQEISPKSAVAVPTLRIGERVKVMGVDSQLADQKIVDGVRHELYYGVRKGNRISRAAIRSVDVDTGNVVQTRQFKNAGEADIAMKKLSPQPSAVAVSKTPRGSPDAFGTELTPVASALIHDIGGVLSKSAAAKAGKLKGNEESWDGAGGLQHPTHNKIYNPKGEMPDVAAQHLYDMGLIKEPTEDAMWAAIARESQTARIALKEEKAQTAAAKAAEKTTTPTLRPGEKQGDLLSTQQEDLTLVGEKGIDHSADAAKAEQAQKDAEIAKAEQDKLQGELAPAPAVAVAEATGPTSYSNGDKIQYIGTTQQLHGGKFYDFKYLDGTKAGQLGVTSEPPKPTVAPKVAPKTAEPVNKAPHELANDVSTDLGKQLVMPKEFDAKTDFIRATDAKGRVAILPASELKGDNILKGAGPFTKLEAGRKSLTGPNKGKFIPSKEPITTTYEQQKPTTQTKQKPASNSAGKSPGADISKTGDTFQTPSLSKAEGRGYSQLNKPQERRFYTAIRHELNELAPGRELVASTTQPHPAWFDTKHPNKIFVNLNRLAAHTGVAIDNGTHGVDYIRSVLSHEIDHTNDPLLENETEGARQGISLLAHNPEQIESFFKNVVPTGNKADRDFYLNDPRQLSAEMAVFEAQLQREGTVPGHAYSLLPVKHTTGTYDPAFEQRVKDINAARKPSDPGLLKVIEKNQSEQPIQSGDTVHGLPTSQKIFGAVKNVPDYIDEAVGRLWEDAKTLGKAFAPANRWAAWLNAAETKTNVGAEQATNNVRGTLREVMQRSIGDSRSLRDARALTFIVEAGGDKAALNDMQKKITAARDSGRYDVKKGDSGGVFWRNRTASALDAIVHAKNNFVRLNHAAAVYTKTTNDQIAFEHANGQDTPYRQNYVPHDLEDNRGFGLFGGSGTGASKSFEKMRDYKTFADAIANGETPSTLNSLELLKGRLAAGLGYINRQQWAESGRNIIDPATGKPLVTSMEIKTNPQSGKVETSPPKGYVQRSLGLQPIAVHEGYYPMMYDLITTPSVIRQSPIGSVALSTEGAIKHGLLLFDTFHLGRLAFYASSMGVKPTGYAKGLLTLDYSADELKNMERRGELPKDIKVAELIKQKTDLQTLINEGLNLGSIQDAVNAGIVQKIPGIGKFNRYVFDQFQRGIMTQAGLQELQRTRLAFPELSDKDAARKVAKDINTRFGNLGKEGWFRSDTLRDAASLSFLAPSWNEGLLRSEAGAYKQAGKAAADIAFKRKFRAGTLLKSSGSLLLGMFVFNQLLNYITRGKPTWQNPEEGIGAKLSAWIPDFIGHGPGFFLNPMTLPMELSHQVLEVMDKTGVTAKDAVLQVLGYKISPPARVVKTAVMSTDQFGRSLNSWWDEAKAMIAEVAPLPIATVSAVSAIKSIVQGKAVEPYRGAIEKQAFATSGIKLDTAASPATRIYALANKFDANHNISRHPDFASTDYTKLNASLNSNDLEQAQKEYDKLLINKTPVQINTHYVDQVNFPFSGSTTHEQMFRNSLNPEQQQTYEQARADKWRLRNAFFSAGFKAPDRTD